MLTGYITRVSRLVMGRPHTICASVVTIGVLFCIIHIISKTHKIMKFFEII